MENKKSTALPETERRLFRRVPYRTPLEIQNVSASDSGNVFEVIPKRIFLRSCNISEGGMGLLLPFVAKPGSVLKVTYRTGAERMDQVEVFVRVVWNKGSKHGVRFLMLGNEARENIRDIVRKVEANRRKRRPATAKKS
jgi:c-di-GMP-binding flagellar brake protein YcgR